MQAYVDFWASLSVTEWVMIIGLVVALILVALAAAAFGNPARAQLPRRPTPLPDHRPPIHPSSLAERPYLGVHRQVDPQERTVNLSKYRRRKPE